MKSGERAATRDTRPVIALAALTGLALLVSRNNPNSNGMAPDLPASRHPPEKQDDVAVPSPPQLFFCDESLCTSANGDCCAPTHGQCDDSLCTSAGGDCCAPNGEEGTCMAVLCPCVHMKPAKTGSERVHVLLWRGGDLQRRVCARAYRE